MKKIGRDIIRSYALAFPPVRTAHQRDTEVKIGWKGAYAFDVKTWKHTPVLVKLAIPADALRTMYYTDGAEKYSKHRCSYVQVLGFYSYYTGKELKKVSEARSFFTMKTTYMKGALAFPGHYSYRNAVCGQGIHYFYNKESALIYLDNICNEHDYKLRKDNMWARK